MLFPIIKVVDKDNSGSTRTHIVGTGIHDSLYIDKETGGIHYYNLQNGEGTIRYKDSSTYDFCGTPNTYHDYLNIEFVSFEELSKIYSSQMKKEEELKRLKEKLAEEIE